MNAPACPYCQTTSELCSGSDVYPHRPKLADLIMYRCQPCGAWVGCHPGTNRPLGRLANAALRKAKQRAHEAFDVLWQPGPRQRTGSRAKAYYWLALRLRIRPEECHIGMFDVARCEEVVKVSNEASAGGAFSSGGGA